MTVKFEISIEPYSVQIFLEVQLLKGQINNQNNKIKTISSEIKTISSEIKTVSSDADEADAIHPLVSKSINLVHLKHVHSTDSSYNYRFSVRMLTKQPNSTRCRRDRETSRLSSKKIILAMRKRKNRTFLKHNMLKSAPK